MQVFTALYNTDDNCLVAAPTGSGKTACAEFAVLRMIQKASQDKGAARCVYIAPLPGLAKERLADWSAKASIRLTTSLHTAPMHPLTQWASGLRVGEASSTFHERTLLHGQEFHVFVSQLLRVGRLCCKSS